MKRLFAATFATVLMLGLTAVSWASQVVGRCPGKCPLCP